MINGRPFDNRSAVARLIGSGRSLGGVVPVGNGTRGPESESIGPCNNAPGGVPGYSICAPGGGDGAKPVGFGCRTAPIG
jgi:hypothetical protein